MTPGIKGLVCRSCWKLVPPSGRHWMSECSEPTIHPGLVQAALDSEGNEFHKELILTPTTVLGKVRDEFIRRTLPYAPEAQGVNSLIVGTAVGERVEEGLVKGGWTRQVEVRGTLLGKKFKGRMDTVLFDPNGGVFAIENKFAGAGEFYYTRSGHVAKVEVSAQVNMGVHLLSQMDERVKIDSDGRPANVEMQAWTGTIARAAFDKKSGQFVDPWIRQRVPPMNLQEIGAVRPGGAGNTVAEAVEWLDAAFTRVKEGEDPVEVLKSIPHSCETMYGGACRPYCGSNRTCLKLRGVALQDKGIVQVAIPWEEWGL